jgi:hypothetical protein
VWTSVGFSIKGFKKPSQVPRLDLSQQEEIRPRLTRKSDCHATESTVRPKSAALYPSRLPRPTGVNKSRLGG